MYRSVGKMFLLSTKPEIQAHLVTEAEGTKKRESDLTARQVTDHQEGSRRVSALASLRSFGEEEMGRSLVARHESFVSVRVVSCRVLSRRVVSCPFVRSFPFLSFPFRSVPFRSFPFSRLPSTRRRDHSGPPSSHTHTCVSLSPTRATMYYQAYLQRKLGSLELNMKDLMAGSA